MALCVISVHMWCTANGMLMACWRRDMAPVLVSSQHARGAWHFQWRLRQSGTPFTREICGCIVAALVPVLVREKREVTHSKNSEFLEWCRHGHQLSCGHVPQPHCTHHFFVSFIHGLGKVT